MPIDRPGRRSSHRQPYDHGEPIRWLNLAPLAGIAGIAAALILSAYGVTPHAVTVNLPMPNAIPPPIAQPRIVEIAVSENGRAMIDGETLTDTAFARRLEQLARASPRPGISFTPHDSALYADSLRVLGLIEQAGLTGRDFCFGSTERNRRFGTAEDTVAPVAAERSFERWPPCDPYGLPVPGESG